MTTYIIGLVVVALLYGVIWNNRSARSYTDSSPTRTGPGPDGATTGAGGTSRPTSKMGSNRTDHQ